VRELKRQNGTLMAPRLCSEIIPAAVMRRKTVKSSLESSAEAGRSRVCSTAAVSGVWSAYYL